jgi:hypothetical protein
MSKNQTTSVPPMKSLSSVMNKAVEDGYKANFEASSKGIKEVGSGKIYDPEKLKVVNFYRFEGASDPADNSILYVIEASDGTKGMLVDAYGAYSDPDIDKVIKKIPVIEKQQ